MVGMKHRATPIRGGACSARPSNPRFAFGKTGRTGAARAASATGEEGTL